MNLPPFVRLLLFQIPLSALLSFIFVFSCSAIIENRLNDLFLDANQINLIVKTISPSFYLFSFLFLFLISLFQLLQKEALFLPIRSFLQSAGLMKEEKSAHISFESFETHMQELSKSVRAFELLGDRIREMDKDLFHAEVEKRAILESLEEGVIAVDRMGVLSYINHKAQKFLSPGKDLLPGDSLFSKNSHHGFPLLTQSIALLKDSLEQDNETKDEWHQEGHWFDLLATPIIEGSGAILVIKDVTSQRKMVEMGKGFIANASHELRTPITIIKGFAETLNEVPEISSAMLEDIIEKILRNCQRMELLIKNLLLLADLDYTSNIQPCECDLIAFIEQIIHNILSVHPNVRIETLCNVDQFLTEVDVGLLEIAIMNLLQNGIKYSTPPAHLTIKLEVKEPGFEISISDHGVGIPQSDLPHIFDRFYTVNKAHSRKLGGAGLGLSIVKLIIQKHHGKISVQSEVNKGTTFTLHFKSPDLEHIKIS